MKERNDMNDEKKEKRTAEYFPGFSAMMDGLAKVSQPTSGAAGSPVIKIKNVTININCYNGRKKR